MFITFTCNPNWIQIQRELKYGEKAYGCPDLCARVFQAKLTELLDDLLHKNALGQVIANVHVVEFQKRGLSHAHLLLILAANNKPRDASQYEKTVSAEVPDPTPSTGPTDLFRLAFKDNEGEVITCSSKLMYIAIYSSASRLGARHHMLRSASFTGRLRSGS